MYVYIGFKTFSYVLLHLDSIASYLPTGLHLGFFRPWPSRHPRKKGKIPLGKPTSKWEDNINLLEPEFYI